MMVYARRYKFIFREPIAVHCTHHIVYCVVASSAKHLLVVEVVIVVELTLLVVVKEEIMAVRVVVMGVKVEVEVDVVVVVVIVVKTLNTALCNTNLPMLQGRTSSRKRVEILSILWFNGTSTMEMLRILKCQQYVNQLSEYEVCQSINRSQPPRDVLSPSLSSI